MRRLTALMLTAGLLTSLGCDSSENRINAGGATFVKHIMQKWAEVYRENTGVEIDYQPTGSGAGIQQMTAGTIQFGCSDAPMTAEQVETAKAERGEVTHIPIVMGAVAIVYNVPGIDQPLRLSGEVIADIYLGKITTWDNQAIKDLNPDVAEKLPGRKIIPIYRAESSGTTNIFTEYLSKRSGDFKSAIGPSKEPTWQEGIGLGQKGSDGVAGFVKANEGAIGYVELSYAEGMKIPYALIRNRAGEFIAPTPEAVTAAAAAAMQEERTEEPYSLHELTYSLTDAEGEESYPIAALSYAILAKRQPQEQGQHIVAFLKWATTDGQQYCEKLYYAPLPEELRERIQEELDEVELTE